MKKQTKALVVSAFIVALLWFGHTPDVPVDVLLKKYRSDASQFVSNQDGLTVHYRDEGVKGNHVIVLVHGNSGSLHTFEPLVKKLMTDYRVISLDFPGHGLTGAHPEHKYGYQQLADALSLVVKHLALDHYTLLGHSMGGWVSWRYAVDHPHQLSSLILMSASGMPPRDGDPKQSKGIGFKLLASPIGPLLSRYSIPRSVIKNSTLHSVYDKAFATDSLISMLWELLRHPDNRTALAHRANVDRETDKASLAKTIDVPTLLIWGEQDTFVPPSASLSFSEQIRDTHTVMLPNVGHMPMLEATQEVASAMHEFLVEKER